MPTLCVSLGDDWNYDELTRLAARSYRDWPDLNDATRSWLIRAYSALEATPAGDVKSRRAYPLSGAILLDIIEEYEVPQWRLALILGISRHVVSRRVNVERRLRKS